MLSIRTSALGKRGHRIEKVISVRTGDHQPRDGLIVDEMGERRANQGRRRSRDKTVKDVEALLIAT